jgi:hypothetical protein
MSYLCQLEPYLCLSCDQPENGRISAVAYVVKGAPLSNPSDVQEWVNLICNNLAIVIPSVRGTYDGGSAIEQTGYGRQTTFRAGANHEVQYMHPWVCENVAFYNSLMRVANNYEFWFMTGSKLHKGGDGIYVNAQMPITDDVSSLIEFNVTVRWSRYELPRCFEPPILIFDSCESLQRALDCYRCTPISTIPCP